MNGSSSSSGWHNRPRRSPCQMSDNKAVESIASVVGQNALVADVFCRSGAALLGFPAGNLLTRPRVIVMAKRQPVVGAP